MPIKPKKITKRNGTQYSGGAVGNFYSQSAWRSLRALKIRMNPLCEMCLKIGIITPAQMVDHKKPIQDGGAALDMDNTQSLCNACHATKTGKETAKRRNEK